MRVTATALPGVLILEPTVFADARGFFYESFNQREFEALTGVSPAFVQDNHSRSLRNALRGVHYQLRRPQGKLIRVVAGEIFDVAVDLRRDSPTFGRWEGLVLSAENRRQLWIPPGFAHGFLTCSEAAEVLYKVTDYWSPDDERAIAWNDPDLAIAWPLAGLPLVSDRDAAAPQLAMAETYP